MDHEKLHFVTKRVSKTHNKIPDLGWCRMYFVTMFYCVKCSNICYVVCDIFCFQRSSLCVCWGPVQYSSYTSHYLHNLIFTFSWFYPIFPTSPCLHQPLSLLPPYFPQQETLLQYYHSWCLMTVT